MLNHVNFVVGHESCFKWVSLHFCFFGSQGTFLIDEKTKNKTEQKQKKTKLKNDQLFSGDQYFPNQYFYPTKISVDQKFLSVIFSPE